MSKPSLNKHTTVRQHLQNVILFDVYNSALIPKLSGEPRIHSHQLSVSHRRSLTQKDLVKSQSCRLEVGWSTSPQYFISPSSDGLTDLKKNMAPCVYVWCAMKNFFVYTITQLKGMPGVFHLTECCKLKLTIATLEFYWWFILPSLDT